MKLAFLVQKIAEKEEIKGVAGRSAAPHPDDGADVPDSAREIHQGSQKRNGIVEIHDQLSSEKVLEFLGEQCRRRDRARESLIAMLKPVQKTKAGKAAGTFAIVASRYNARATWTDAERGGARIETNRRCRSSASPALMKSRSWPPSSPLSTSRRLPSSASASSCAVKPPTPNTSAKR